MKNFSRIIATLGLAALAIAANAQVKGRSFEYKSFDTIDQDFSAAGDVSLKARTTVNVMPYLYISGSLSADWNVDGWGTGVDTQSNSIMFFHNETLTLDLEGFANPKKFNGTKTGNQEIDLSAQLSFFNAQTDNLLFKMDSVPAEKLNDMFNPNGPSFEAGITGGLMRLELARTISITPEVGPGSYANYGFITVIRN